MVIKVDRKKFNQ